MDSSFSQLISEKLIQPSSSTPIHLKSYKLSFIDQLMFSTYVPTTLFYPNQNKTTPNDPNQIPQDLLEKSLSKLLSSYYPFAGTLSNNNISVDYNDRGSTFVEAYVKCSMSDVLRQPDPIALDVVFPGGVPRSNCSEEDSPVVAQLTHFSCGGISLSVCLSHKLGDGTTLMNFLKDWASMTRQSASIFPPSSDPTSLTAPIDKKQRPVLVGRRIVIDSKSLNQLKALVAAETDVQNPTRVEVVTALLFKCAMTAKTESLQQFRPSFLVHMVNLRPLTNPPLPSTSAGNMVNFLVVPIADEGEVTLPRLVSELRRLKVEYFEKYKALNPDELYLLNFETAERLKFPVKMEKYHCSSLCGYPSHHFDFGWGRPLGVEFGAVRTQNTFMLTDGQDGNGVVAQVNLDEKVMQIFEKDKDVLAFTSLNPSFSEM